MGKKITLASRDSLLALAQTIEAANRLARCGFTPTILTMKTAGDMNLTAPLYEVAQRTAGKEGRAFFTKELDEALLSGKADAAVHSFKDLPTESIEGIAAPIFFGEESGADVLLLAPEVSVRNEGRHLSIGTSSLRRIHQLGLILPEAKTITLRGNLITRLEKLLTSHRGMNAILIAAAGFNRLSAFAQLDEQSYANYVSPEVLLHIRQEVKRFVAAKAALSRTLEFPERYFPTAPGQGVLALQLSARAFAQYAELIAPIFAEHDSIAERVSYERRVMAALMTGCHAPLGVSASHKLPSGQYQISACYSRRVTTEPLDFADSVWFERLAVSTTESLVHDLRGISPEIYWWGLNPPLQQTTLTIHFVEAIEQSYLDTTRDYSIPEAVFVASRKAAEWLTGKPELSRLPLYAAGVETAKHLKQLIKNVHVIATNGTGFVATLSALPRRDLQLLWVGSREGEARARALARGYTGIQFLPVYKNTPVIPRDLTCPATALHVITSAVAAQAFVAWSRTISLKDTRVCSFGESSTKILSEHNILCCHVSQARSFLELIREIKGDPTLIIERWRIEEQEQ